MKYPIHPLDPVALAVAGGDGTIVKDSADPARGTIASDLLRQWISAKAAVDRAESRGLHDEDEEWFTEVCRVMWAIEHRLAALVLDRLGFDEDRNGPEGIKAAEGNGWPMAAALIDGWLVVVDHEGDFGIVPPNAVLIP